MEAELFHADRWTKRHVTKLTVSFLNLANALENQTKINYICPILCVIYEYMYKVVQI